MESKAKWFKIRRAYLNSRNWERTTVVTITKWVMYNTAHLCCWAASCIKPSCVVPSCTAPCHYSKLRALFLASPPLKYILGLTSVWYWISSQLVWSRYSVYNWTQESSLALTQEDDPAAKVHRTAGADKLLGSTSHILPVQRELFLVL